MITAKQAKRLYDAYINKEGKKIEEEYKDILAAIDMTVRNYASTGSYRLELNTLFKSKDMKRINNSLFLKYLKSKGYTIEKIINYSEDRTFIVWADDYFERRYLK